MALDQFLNAAAYVELNTVKLALRYRWNSARAHIKGKDAQGIIDIEKLLEICAPIILCTRKINFF